jgi:NTE family protein
MSASGHHAILLSPDSSRSEFLAAVPIFAELSEELRDEVAALATTVHVPAGEWLFRQGDEDESLYVVRSGRLEVVVEEPEPMVVRVLARGSALGELALLTGSPRSASVRARRDTELLRLHRDRFASLLQDEPSFATALTRELGNQLRESRGLETPDPPLPATIALLPLEPNQPVARVCERLISTLSRWGTVGRFAKPAPGVDPSSYTALLDDAERQYKHVLLLAGLPADDDPWTDFCLRQADRVIALAQSADPSTWLEQYPALRGCDLLLRPPSPGAPVAIAPWVDALSPRGVYQLDGRSTSGDPVECLARRLAGRSVGVILSGGGSRGLAHIGVLEVLTAAGIQIDRVAGCSMGSYVGALFAMGLDTDEMQARCREEFVERNPLSDYTVPVVSLVRGQRARRMMIRSFGLETTIEELPREFFCVSCDLLSGELVVHRRGLLHETVGASMCLPGVFAPVLRDGQLLVDGGVLCNLPVEQMAKSGEGPVIAVDVTARFAAPGARESRIRRARMKQWANSARRAVVGVEDPLPNLKEILTRSIVIGSVDALAAARGRADVLITPETGEVGLLDFRQLDRMVELGREAAGKALDAAKALAAS